MIPAVASGIAGFALGVVVVTSLALSGFGANLLYLTWRATRLRPRPGRVVSFGDEPRVCVQVPIYNERYVAERVLDAVCEMRWPRGRLEVQVLDDSDDETTSIIAARCARWRRVGIEVTHVRRDGRDGFKAGALAHGMTLTDAPFIAIFDADFVPPPDFLRRTLAAFDDPKIGFVQARWGHLDEGYSWFTRVQALAIDFHFLVEQAVRSSRGYFTNFTGTAGVWRRAAIEDSGGWSAATLTEDLDLSYRAQLRGWRAAYIEDLVVPEELPVSIDAYRRQQSRWATGSFQSAFRLLIPVLRSRNRPAVKLQAAVHLLAYGVGPLMLLQLACYPLLLLSVDASWVPWPVADSSIVVIAISVSPWIGFMVAQTRRGRPWWSGLPSVLCQMVGAGMSLTVLVALARATRSGGVFVRTPKHRIVQRGQEWRDQAYVHVGDPRAFGEALLALASLAIVALAIGSNQGVLAMFASLFALGFLTVAGLSVIEFLEVLTLRNLGRIALARLRAAAPGIGLIGLCGLLLLAAAQMPEPFEDGYAHWLIAANLASTGVLHDPLFGMQDTWLPAYHVLAAVVLHVFGLWQLGALKALSALLGVATLACVYGIAPTARQGRLAVILLALNPVFLFTSGSAVVEPLLTALLAGAALAAVQGRMKLAALLAALALITSTKAWIWIAVVGGIFVFEQVRAALKRGSVRRLPAAAFAVPALAVLVFLQLGFAPVTNSLARGSVEVMSAGARGSIPVDASGRLIELATTYGLAALPLFALGLIGLVFALRRPALVGGPAAVRFLHVPSAVYLIAVFGLVAAGVYTGSHRYLYPALPALALSAAAMLDRQASPARLIAAAASAVLAVGFLPVFASFAAVNSGLIAAGRAASGDQGVLVTDSPVAAFYSGRPPADITGSQSLPGNPDEAIEWMRAHEVTDLVLEDISYYRASSVFPDLVTGHSSTLFSPLGDQSSYQVAGGKTVYAYRTAVAMQTILPGIAAAVSTPPGQGKTAPLAKGLTLKVDGKVAAGEGMGFGVPIVHYPDGWVYSRTATTVTVGATWTRTYEMDEIGGDAQHGYAFVPIPSRGEVVVTYTVDATGVSVSARVVELTPGYIEVGILNEESAQFNDFVADGSPTLIDGEFGSWVPVTGRWARLQSRSLAVQWSVPGIAGAQLHRGRELAPPGFDWAGLDYVFPATFTDVSYHINVQRAR
jgi:cellulose synthase/poly-beta-1,6-N-acetylglucosamine synthase-like glycosyltransferase